MQIEKKMKRRFLGHISLFFDINGFSLMGFWIKKT